ncbi:MAG: PHP domain-containing protein [Chloroflexota bacterium]|nr:PHP domain-containing protein [Chloroflexota bacterium]
MSRFTYLYLHTHFSRDGGPASPSQWCRAAAELGYQSLGVADRGPLAAFPLFSKAARAAGIRPVYGMEADIVLPSTGVAEEPGTLPAAFFARDRQGMDNLAKLASLAYARWPREEQPLAWETVAEHSAGLALVLLVDNAGAGDLDRWGEKVRDSFGEAAYIRLAPPGAESNRTTQEKLIAVAGRMGLSVIAMPAARYVRPQDRLSYQALQVARRRAGWATDARTEAEADSPVAQHLLSPDEVSSLYPACPEALENAARLAEMCAGVGYLDEFATETFQVDMQAERSRLRSLTEERLLLRLETDTLPEAVRQWLDDELAAYEKQNALPAWSAIASVCGKARNGNGQPAMPLGAPLGTADGSLMAFAFGISTVNPVDYPRPAWLTTGESSRILPVPGVEVPANRRDEILTALARNYGQDRTALSACVIDIDPLTALSAASEVLGTGADIRSLALQAMSQGWGALAADQAGSNTESPTPAGLAMTLRGAPVAFKSDPDMLLVAPTGGRFPDWLPMLRLVAGQPSAWVPMTEEVVAEMRLPAVTLRPSAALAALASTLTYAAQYPVPGLALAELDLTGYPQLSAEAGAALAKGELVGIPYLSAGAVKGWKGELTPEAVAALAARSVATHKPPAAPKLDQWTEHTADTGGTLLFRDQFEALVMSVAGFSPTDAYRLRALLLRGSADEPTVQLKEAFVTGCTEKGVDAEATEALWQALAASAPDLQSRCSIAVRARTAMWAAFFKSAHPAAFLAAHLSACIERGAAMVPPLVGAAHRLRVGIKAPDASHSQPAPTLERGGSEWTILWGLALLPGWSKDEAARFVAARPRGGFTGMSDLVASAVDASLTLDQLETLVRAGACDTLSGKARSRDGLVEALPEWLEWARADKAQTDGAGATGPVDLFSFNDAQSPAPPSEEATLSSATPTPRERYSRREWEVRQLGVAFTQASEIESLKRTLDRSHLRSRLLRSVQVGEEHVGKSVNLVGLLTCVRLVSPPGSNGKSPVEPMSVAWLEDAEGTIELVAFPPGYKRHADLWAENKPVIVTARVRKHDEGDIYLLCEHMAPFEEAAEEAELTVKVKQSKKAQAALEEVTAKANAHGGNGTNGYNGANNGNGTHAAAAPAPTHAPTTKPPTTAPTPTQAPAATPIAAATSTATTAPTMTNPATITTGGMPAHKIIITLPITEDDQADIDRMIALKEILHEHPGSDAVTLRIPYAPEPGYLTTAQLPRGVAYNTVLEAEVVRLLGTEAIAVIRL